MISVIIPCHNEAESIGKVIDGVKKNLSNFKYEIIVVDNNSKDRTSEVAKDRGVKVLFEKKIGKGNAVKRGAKNSGGDILVFIDGDNSYPPKFIPRVLEPILNGKIDIVYGSRFLKESKTEISFSRFVGQKFFSILASIYKKNTDFFTGLFAIRKNKFFELDLKSQGFEMEAEIFKKAVKKKFKIKEVPIDYKINKNSNLRPIKDGLKILKTLIFTK